MVLKSAERYGRSLQFYGQLPILMLTAHGEVTDRIVGLELGADDYLPKPFEPRELVARIHNILRRTSDEGTVTKRRQAGGWSGDRRHPKGSKTGR